MTTLMERKVEGAPWYVELRSVPCVLGPEGVSLGLVVEISNNQDTVIPVYLGENGREALDAFAHPFALPHVTDVFKTEVA